MCSFETYRPVDHIVLVSFISGRIHSDVSRNLQKKMYHIKMTNLTCQYFSHILGTKLCSTECLRGCLGGKFDISSINSHRNYQKFMIYF